MKLPRVFHHRRKPLIQNTCLRISLLILSIAAIIFFTPIIVIYLNNFFYDLPIKIYKAPNNTFYEIVVPPNNPSSQKSVFKYSKLVSKSVSKNKCLKRTKARHEFIRVLGKNLRQENMKEPVYVIIGASTALGVAITRKFAYKEKPYIALNGINEIDFSSDDSYIPFENITIKQVFIIYQPPLSHHSTTDGSEYISNMSVKYIDRLTSYLNDREIPFVFAPVSPIPEEVMTTALRNGACVVEVPYLLDKNAFYDIENPVMRAVRQCRIKKSATIDVYPSMNYHSIRADEASKFVRHQIKYENDLKKGRFAIYGATNISVQEAVQTAVQAAGYGDCKLTFRDTPHKIEIIPDTNHRALVGGEDDDVKQMIKEVFTEFSRTEKGGIYLSIVVVGQNDPTNSAFIEHIKRFLERINDALEKIPLANIEIVFADYATDIKKSSLIHEELLQMNAIGQNIIDKIQFIVVPPDVHRDLLTNTMKTSSNKVKVLEYVGRNVGIRRAQGKFILTTTVETLLSDEFFELVAARQFNTDVLYRSTRIDEKEATFQNATYANLIQALNEPWRINNFDIKSKCSVKDSFSIVDSPESFDHKISFCGAADFLILSKKMWDAIEGFDELPANENIEKLFLAKLMRFIPGYAQITMKPPIFHMKKKFTIPTTDNFEDEMKEYLCYGKCLKCEYNSQYWGLANAKLNIYTKENWS